MRLACVSIGRLTNFAKVRLMLHAYMRKVVAAFPPISPHMPMFDPKPDQLLHETAPTPFRSALMAKVKGKDTKPEMAVRRLAHRLGFRFRLHVKGMAGSPDLVFPRRRRVVFVHGCFWHRHEGCRRTTTPSTRRSFWNEKFRRNVERDAEVSGALQADGWEVLVVWECETKNVEALAIKLEHFLR